jgi:predicted transcriptional regulator
MIAEEIISNEIPPLKTSDSGLKAIGWMEEFKIAHLPIVNHTDFLGLISEEDIYNLNAPEEALGNHQLSLTRPYVRNHQHIYEVIKRVAELNLSVIPVLDDQDKYLGLITVPDLVKQLATLSAIKDHGGILVLELNERDYNLSQIAQIVESNDCRVLSIYVNSIPDSTKLEVTLKVNRTDLRAVIATFTRYNYIIKGSFMETGDADDLNKRYDLLMNYLNM